MKRVRALLVLAVALSVGLLGCSKFKASRELREIEKEIPNATTTGELRGLALGLDVYPRGAVNPSKWDDVRLSLEIKYGTVWNAELSGKLADIEREVAGINSFKKAHEVDNRLDLLFDGYSPQPQPGATSRPTWDYFYHYSKVSEENKTWIQEIERQVASKIQVYRREAPIVITSVYPSRPNSAGGVDVHITFINKSDRTFKYVTFGVTPYNAVGDKVSSEIGDKSSARLKSTGPYEPGHGNRSGYHWDCIWYNYSIRSIKLNNVEIEYMDGKEEEFEGEWIDLLLKK